MNLSLAGQELTPAELNNFDQQIDFNALRQVAYFCRAAKREELDGNLEEAREIYRLVVELAIEAHLRGHFGIADITWNFLDTAPDMTEQYPHLAFHRQLWLNRDNPDAIKQLYTPEAIENLRDAAHRYGRASAYFYGLMLYDATYVPANTLGSIRHISMSKITGVCEAAENQWRVVLDKAHSFPYECQAILNEKLYEQQHYLYYLSRENCQPKEKSERLPLDIIEKCSQQALSISYSTSLLSDSNVPTDTVDDVLHFLAKAAKHPLGAEEILWHGKQFEQKSRIAKRDISYSCGADTYRFWLRNAKEYYEIVARSSQGAAQQEAWFLLTKLYPKDSSYQTALLKAKKANSGDFRGDQKNISKKTVNASQNSLASWTIWVEKAVSLLDAADTADTADAAHSTQKTELQGYIHQLSTLISKEAIPKEKIISDMLQIAVRLESKGHTDIAIDVYYGLQLACPYNGYLSEIKKIADQKNCKAAAFFIAATLPDNDDAVIYLIESVNSKSVDSADRDTNSPPVLYIDGFFKWILPHAKNKSSEIAREIAFVQRLLRLSEALELNNYTVAAHTIYNRLLQKCTKLSYLADYLKKIADKTDRPVAAFYYAVMLRTGKGVALNITQSYDYFKIAAKKDPTSVREYLQDNKENNADNYIESILYEEGIIYPKHAEHALACLNKAVVKRNPDALVRLAKAYLYGYESGSEALPVCQNKEKGMALLRQVGLNWLKNQSIYFKEYKILELAMESWDQAKAHEKAAENFVAKYNENSLIGFFYKDKTLLDNAVSAYRLALKSYALAHKLSLPDSVEGYATCLLALAKLGQPDDLFDLGMAYIKGIYFPQNLEEAKSLLEKSCENGHAEAAWQLGCHYENRIFKSRNPDTMALKYYQIAAKNGHAEAAAKLLPPANSKPINFEGKAPD